MRQSFHGDRKKGDWLLKNIEKKFIDWAVPIIPLFIETYHLTLLTLVWSGLILIFSYLAKDTIGYLWIVSLMIVMQYITDVLDGAVGRFRNTGLVKWGYFMDHFLDYVFLCSLIIGLSFLVTSYLYILILLALAGSIMVNSFLSFSTINQFRISIAGFGPTETRIGFIFLNTLIIFFGTSFLEVALPISCIVLFIVLCIGVYKNHKTIWDIDMEDKVAQKTKSSIYRRKIRDK